MSTTNTSAILQSGWPIVTMKFIKQASDQEATAWLESLSNLLARKRQFVVVMMAAPNSQFSPYARKLQGLWFKQNKKQLKKYCQGLARVLVNANDYERVAGEAMRNAMPFPLFASVHECEALAWAELQLSTLNTKLRVQ